ncbi:hypothetical protein D9V86_00870 [Bacteroidetes/Chlorobi group bacterium ChocPot_Mid]|nr:MAG: hypothetical protein D9V86_00870 [Bacteroidetes/Chlorobi group bacterium ChocPot_Mid]
MRIRKIFKSFLLLLCFAVFVSGYTRSIEKKYSLNFDNGIKSELKVTQFNGKDYINLDDAFINFFSDCDYNKQKMLITFSGNQLVFSPTFYVAFHQKNSIKTFQMSESAIFTNNNLYLPFHSFLKSLESFDIFKITKSQLSLTIKRIINSKESLSQTELTELKDNLVNPNFYLLPPKLNRQLPSEIESLDKNLIADKSKDIAQQNQKLQGLWFIKSFAEQKNNYIDIHFIANDIIDVYHRPECEGKTVIIRIPNANNNISDFSKAEINPILKITPSKVKNFQIYTLSLNDNLIKCTSRRNGDKEIIFSLYPANPQKNEQQKDIKQEKATNKIPEEKIPEIKEIEKASSDEKIITNEKNKPEIPEKATKTEEKTKPQTPTPPSLEKEKKKWELDVIVLDPGHGGNDAGAVGISGTYEKNITLKLALKVRELLKDAMPKTKVILTREDDTFIELYKRGQIANKAEGKLFISIHLNATPKRPSQANGVETYILRPGRNDDAIRVANFENSVIKFEKQSEKYKKLTEEEVIVATMAQSAFVKFSELFARLVQDEVCKITKLEDRGVKQAGFYVLIGASMPNVLIEAAFLSNEGDERFVNSEAGQNKIAKGIVNAILRYAEEYNKY